MVVGGMTASVVGVLGALVSVTNMQSAIQITASTNQTTLLKMGYDLGIYNNSTGVLFLILIAVFGAASVNARTTLPSNLVIGVSLLAIVLGFVPNSAVGGLNFFLALITLVAGTISRRGAKPVPATIQRN